MLKVIGAGFGRTGTLSLKAALERLDFKRCYHMVEVMARRHDHAAMWLDKARGWTVDWDAMFEGYEAAVDFPVALYWEELAKHYPQAKIILTIRDADSWYDSAAATIYQGSRMTPALRLIPFVRDITQSVDLSLWGHGGIFAGRFEDREFAIGVYNRWITEVRKRAHPERLLVYDVADGWEPLCQFLGVPVPDEAFPRVNDRQVMVRRISFLRWFPWLVFGLLFTLAGIAGMTWLT